MNKETRKFIVGLLGSIICMVAFAIGVVKIHEGELSGAFEITGCAINAIGIILFARMVHDTAFK